MLKLHKSKLLLGLFLLFFLNTVPPALLAKKLPQMAELLDLQVNQFSNKIQLLFLTNKKIKAHAILSNHSQHLIVDLENTALATDVANKLEDNAFIEKVEVSESSSHNLRLNFKLKSQARMEVEHSSSSHLKPFTLVIYPTHISNQNKQIDSSNQKNEDTKKVATLKTTLSENVAQKSDPTTNEDQKLPDDDLNEFRDELKSLKVKNSIANETAENEENKEKKIVKEHEIKQVLKEEEASNASTIVDKSPTNIAADETLSRETQDLPHSRPRAGKIVVVIDPGHGGKDPGASGPHGTHEKDVVLSIAKDLQQDINRNPRFIAKLTRKSDYYLTLRQRLDVARKDKGDFFVAIHADAYMNNDAEGASVFALSQSGATSEAAHWLASQENYSELGGVRDFSGKSYLVRKVLLDLSQTVTISQSLQIGYVLLHALGRITTLHHDIVEQARFVVLKSPDIPSLLVETGFITNPYEEARLKNPIYQEKLAQALSVGITGYFEQHPPQDVVENSNSEKLKLLSKTKKLNHHSSKK